MKIDLIKEIELKKGVTAVLEGSLLKVKGPKGEVSRDFIYPGISIRVDAGKVVMESKKATKREKKIISSFAAHIKNMVKGVEEPHEYILKICSGHFPMNVSVSGKDFAIKNFLGESVPRKLKLSGDVSVKVDGDKIIVVSPDKETAGKAAAQIENLCRITNRDRRIFQDGCYMIQKSGKRL